MCPAKTVNLEDEVRTAVGLASRKNLHPAGQCVFFRQEDAIKHIQSLMASGQYEASDVGLFAKEINSTGGRKFIVDTYAGFALKRCPSHKNDWYPDHYYEIIRESRPCWLYFDLEFSRIANPFHDVNKVTDAFYRAFDQFCRERLKVSFVTDSIVELDSTTLEKFSKHVIIKKWRRLVEVGGNGSHEASKEIALAFCNNAQAGLVVTEFVKYLQGKLEESNGQSALVNELFFTGSCGAESKVVSLVDECVYSRNRCFRLVFSSKYGKKKTLHYLKGTDLESHDCLQLVNSMASCVPEGTDMFRLPYILDSYSHGKVRARRIVATSQNSKTSTSMQIRRHSNIESRSPLHEHLIKHWDAVRQEKDTEVANASSRPTRVQSSIVVGEIPYVYLSITLTHNRFCFCKGSSHKSNSIYLVINPRRCVFYQKCHDVDCLGYRSEKMPVPKELLLEYTDVPREIIAASLEEIEDARDPSTQIRTENLQDDVDTESEIEAEANAIFVSQADTECDTEADTECDTEAEDTEFDDEVESPQGAEAPQIQEELRNGSYCEGLLGDVLDNKESGKLTNTSNALDGKQIVTANEFPRLDVCDLLLADSQDCQQNGHTTHHIYETPPKKLKPGQNHFERLCSSLWDSSQDT